MASLHRLVLVGVVVAAVWCVVGSEGVTVRRRQAGVAAGMRPRPRGPPPPLAKRASMQRPAAPRGYYPPRPKPSNSKFSPYRPHHKAQYAKYPGKYRPKSSYHSYSKPTYPRPPYRTPNYPAPAQPQPKPVSFNPSPPSGPSNYGSSSPSFQASYGQPSHSYGQPSQSYGQSSSSLSGYGQLSQSSYSSSPSSQTSSFSQPSQSYGAQAQASQTYSQSSPQSSYSGAQYSSGSSSQSSGSSSSSSSSPSSSSSAASSSGSSYPSLSSYGTTYGVPHPTHGSPEPPRYTSFSGTSYKDQSDQATSYVHFYQGNEKDQSNAQTNTYTYSASHDPKRKGSVVEVEPWESEPKEKRSPTKDDSKFKAPKQTYGFVPYGGQGDKDSFTLSQGYYTDSVLSPNYYEQQSTSSGSTSSPA